MRDEELRAHLERVDRQLDEILSLLRPVHAHAGWVDSLRETLHRWRLLPKSSGSLFLKGECKKRKCLPHGSKLYVESMSH